MSARGRKVNKYNPANKAKKAAAKKQTKQEAIEADVNLPRPKSSEPTITPNTGAVSPVRELPSTDETSGATPRTYMLGENEVTAQGAGAVGLGKTGQGRVARGIAKLGESADEKILAEANREKSPAEQEESDAASAGLSVEDLRKQRDFVKSLSGTGLEVAKPGKTEGTAVDLSSDEVDQPRGDWSQGTKTGIFTPAPTGAIRGNRAQPPSITTQENTKSRIARGMGVSGLERGTETEKIIHPVHGEMEVPADVARAHRLYDLDWQTNPGKANRLAGLSGDEDYASPYQHKGGHYERLGRLQGAGQKVDDIKNYARKMGQTEYDAVESMHALLQDKKDSDPTNKDNYVNYGLQHLHPEDTFTHPETGQTHPISEWSTVHNMPITGEGLPDLSATKGTSTSVYTDSQGKQQTTVPTHIGWWKNPTDGVSGRENLHTRPGNWTFKTSPVALDANPQTKPVPAFDFVAQQSREALPIGSKVSRAEIGEAARAMAAIHAASSGAKAPGRVSTSQVTNPATGRPITEIAGEGTSALSVEPRETTVTTGEPAEDATVYKRKGRGKKISDINHLVSSQLAATVGSGTVGAIGEGVRDTREGVFGEVATGTGALQGRANREGVSAFQPGKKVVAGTAAENLETSEQLRAQEGPTPEEQTKAALDKAAKGYKAPEEPTHYVDASGNPIPQPPKTGQGRAPIFVRKMGGAPTVSSQLQGFTRVHGTKTGEEGPQVTSGYGAKPERRSKKTGLVIEPELKAQPGMTAFDTPFSPGAPEAAELRAHDKEIQDAVSIGIEKNPAKPSPTMKPSEVKKFSRIYLEDNPDKGPEQPMLDFGQPEREEEQKRAALAKANKGVDPTTGKRFKRQGQQWGFLDPRWIGNLGSGSSELNAQVREEERTKGAEKPRAQVTPPSGLPQAGPKSAPIKLTGSEGPATLRILGEMHGSAQIQAALAKVRGGQAQEE